MRDTHIYGGFIHSLSPHHPRFSSLPLYILGEITLWIGKGTLGPQARGPCFFFFSFFFWIIDSRCLVIHRLHMPANSSGGEKLPTSQPCLPHTRPEHTHAHTHTIHIFAHLTLLNRTFICTHIQTHTILGRVQPPSITTSHHLLHHSPLKSQELGMRGGSERQVSGWKTWDDRWGALWHYEWIIPPKYLEQCRLSACIYTNLGENIAVSTLKGAGKERATELIEQSGH